VIDEQQDPGPRGGLDLVLGAVAAEDLALVVGVIDVAPQVDDGMAGSGKVPTSMPRSSFPSMSMMWS